MARVLGIKYVPTTTGWETLVAASDAVPRGTEVLVTDVVASNQTGGAVTIDLAIVEGDATPDTTDLIVEAQSLTANTIVSVAYDISTGQSLPLAAGQTLKARLSATGPAIRVYGRQASEGFIFDGSGPVAS